MHSAFSIEAPRIHLLPTLRSIAALNYRQCTCLCTSLCTWPDICGHGVRFSVYDYSTLHTDGECMDIYGKVELAAHLRQLAALISSSLITPRKMAKSIYTLYQCKYSAMTFVSDLQIAASIATHICN